MIYFGNKKITDLNYGGTPIKEAYYGSTLVWRRINTPPIVIPEPVDLGLSSGTLWYPLNLGSDSESDGGTLYSFNEVTGIVEYPDPSGGNNPITEFEFIDPAYNILHEGRKTPWVEHWEELLECNKEIVDIGGYYYYKITGPNNNYITVPFGKYLTNTQVVEDTSVVGIVIFEVYDICETIIHFRNAGFEDEKLYRCRPIKQI